MQQLFPLYAHTYKLHRRRRHKRSGISTFYMYIKNVYCCNSRTRQTVKCKEINEICKFENFKN